MELWNASFAAGGRERGREVLTQPTPSPRKEEEDMSERLFSVRKKKEYAYVAEAKENQTENPLLLLPVQQYDHV